LPIGPGKGGVFSFKYPGYDAGLRHFKKGGKSMLNGRQRRVIQKLNVSSLTQEQLAKTIDHAVLKPDSSEAQIRENCSIALKYKVATIGVNPCYVRLCADILKNSEVKVDAVIGFPLGANVPVIKKAEAQRAVEDGAAELDMVLSIGALKEGNYKYVREEIQQVVEAGGGALVKVILETCYLDEHEKIEACKLAEEAGAHYVKTSTGFGPEGAKVEDIKLMYQTVGSRLGVKASGGIRRLSDALAMIEAGATRLGTSATKTIMEDWISKNYK
jgi:deoxyribose-phosphate aldolase